MQLNLSKMRVQLTEVYTSRSKKVVMGHPGYPKLQWQQEIQNMNCRGISSHKLKRCLTMGSMGIPSSSPNPVQTVFEVFKVPG